MNTDMVVQLTVEQLKELIQEAVRSELSSTQTSNETSDTLISREKVMEIANCSGPTITNRIKAGLLNPMQCGKEHRYKESELKIAFPGKF